MASTSFYNLLYLLIHWLYYTNITIITLRFLAWNKFSRNNIIYLRNSKFFSVTFTALSVVFSYLLYFSCNDDIPVLLAVRWYSRKFFIYALKICSLARIYVKIKSVAAFFNTLLVTVAFYMQYIFR